MIDIGGGALPVVPEGGGEDQRTRWPADLVQGPVYAAASVVITRLTKPRG